MRFLTVSLFDVSDIWIDNNWQFHYNLFYHIKISFIRTVFEVVFD